MTFYTFTFRILCGKFFLFWYNFHYSLGIIVKGVLAFVYEKQVSKTSVVVEVQNVISARVYAQAYHPKSLWFVANLVPEPLFLLVSTENERLWL